MKQVKHFLSTIGPGIAIAATGVGAGDMVTAAVAGSRYGYALIWAAVVGALFKYVLNEGLARWQLATGTTLLEGWVQRLGTWVQYYFLVYLVLWSFIVGGALISACGLAAHALAPALSKESWGIIHSLAAAGIVLMGSYTQFEHLMKFFIGFMFVTIIGCAIWANPATTTVSQIVHEAAIPAGSPNLILGVIGGVGGSLTLLAYGYWMREKEWQGARWQTAVRSDLGVSYCLTGLFGVAIMVLAARVLHAKGVEIAGGSGLVRMAGMLGDVMGPAGNWAFLLGFWGAVTTSMLGVWQGVPYMFCDFLALMQKKSGQERNKMVSVQSGWYRLYLLWLALPPLSLLLLNRPVGLIVLYSIVGALFMPFLSATLLYMNSRKDWVGAQFQNGWPTIALLSMCLVLFGYLCFQQVSGIFQ